MKKDLGTSPSRRKRRKLRPWVINIIDISKAIGESIVRLSIIVLIVIGGMKIFSNPSAELTSDLNNVKDEVVEEIKKEETIVVEESHEDIIARLVADVESGKAGNGDARKEYLGEYYSEVQSIINTKYKDTSTKKRGEVIKATSGNKQVYQDYAHTLLLEYGWSEADFNALIILWERESNWNPNATNKSSGAHGIPQSLPASKMASEGDDYMTNYQTQIRWGLKYIKNRYGNPTAALAHSDRKGWY